MRINYNISDLPSGWILLKKKSLTITRSKFHIDEYFAAWEVQNDPGEFKDSLSELDKAMGFQLPFKATKGDLVQLHHKSEMVQLLPDIWAVAPYSILCRLIEEKVEE